MASKVGCLVSFCHHCLPITSVHMHAYCYPLIVVEQNQVCEQLVYVE